MACAKHKKHDSYPEENETRRKSRSRKIDKKKEIASIKKHQQSFSLQSCKKIFLENAIARFELPSTQLSSVNLTDKTWLKIC